jgi:hypothetical protein
MSIFSIHRNANVSKVKLKLKNLSTLTRTAIRKTFYDVGKTLVADAKREIDTQPKHGRIYKKYFGVKGRLKRPRLHVASAPGEAPAVITGNLRKSIDFTVGNMSMTFGVDTTRFKVKYGKYLEYGDLLTFSGQGSPNIKPRPFISASYRKNAENIHRKFINAIDEAMKK